MRYFTTLLSFILLIHLSDLSAQRKSGRKSDRNSNKTVVTTDSTATKDKNQNKSTKSASTSSSPKDSRNTRPNKKLKNSSSKSLPSFDNVDAYISEIKIYLDDMKYQNAAELCEMSLLQYDANAALYFVSAQVAVKLDRLDDANKYFIKAIELDNQNLDYRSEQERLSKLRLGMINARKTFDSGRMNDAIIEYVKLSSDFANHAIVFYNLGRVYKVNEEFNLAVQNYKIAMDLNPFEEKYSLAIMAIAQEKAKVGDTEYRRQEFDSAIENYKYALHYSPNYTTAYFKLARTYFKMKDYENARIYLEQCLSVDPEQEQSEKMLGDIYRRTDDIKKALIHYNKATKINDNYHQAYYSLGSLYLSEGELNKAQSALNKAINIEPTYLKAFGALGIVEQELGNFDIAINNFSKSLAIDPKSYDSHYRLSSVYNIIEQYENAKRSAKESLNIKRNYAPAYFELGIAEKKDIPVLCLYRKIEGKSISAMILGNKIFKCGCYSTLEEVMSHIDKFLKENKK